MLTAMNIWAAISALEAAWLARLLTAAPQTVPLAVVLSVNRSNAGVATAGRPVRDRLPTVAKAKTKVRKVLECVFGGNVRLLILRQPIHSAVRAILSESPHGFSPGGKFLCGGLDRFSASRS